MKEPKTRMWTVISIIGLVVVIASHFYSESKYAKETRQAFADSEKRMLEKRRIVDSSWQAEKAIAQAEMAIAKHRQDSIDKTPWGIQKNKEYEKERKRQQAEIEKYANVAEKLGCTLEDAKRVIRDEIWIGMSYEMVVYQRGKPNSLNISNYGDGDNYQACWDGYAPFCFYFKKEDHIIYAYN